MVYFNINYLIVTFKRKGTSHHKNQTSTSLLSKGLSDYKLTKSVEIDNKYQRSNIKNKTVKGDSIKHSSCDKIKQDENTKTSKNKTMSTLIRNASMRNTISTSEFVSTSKASRLASILQLSSSLQNKRNSLNTSSHRKKSKTDNMYSMTITKSQNEIYHMVSFNNQLISDSSNSFIDCYFPPNITSIAPPSSKSSIQIEENKIYWLRLNEIFQYDDYTLLDKSSESKLNNPNQGWIDNSPVIASIISVCQEFHFIKNIFYPELHSRSVNGQYKILLYIKSTPTLVIIDDYFPCLKGTRCPLFARCNPSNIWPMLLEKALAKVYGSYYALRRATVEEIIPLLIDVTVDSLSFSNKKTIWNALQSSFLHSHYAIASTGSEVRKGLVSKASYVVLRTWEGLSNGEYYRLVKLKFPVSDIKKLIGKFLSSPHGDKFISEVPYYERIDYKWKGRFSYESIDWTDDLKQKIGKYYNESEKKDGIEWMEFTDFYKYFESISVFEVFLPLYSMTFPINSNKSHHLFSFSFNELFDEKVSLICQGKEIILAKIDQGTIVIKAAGKDHINYTRIDKGTYMIYIYNPLLNKTQTNLTINSNERFQAFSLNDKSINEELFYQIIENTIDFYYSNNSKEYIEEDLVVHSGYAIPKSNIGFISIENISHIDYSVNIKLDSNQYTIINKDYSNSYSLELYIKSSRKEYILLYKVNEDTGIVNNIEFHIITSKKVYAKRSSLLSVANSNKEEQLCELFSSISNHSKEESVYSRIILPHL